MLYNPNRTIAFYNSFLYMKGAIIGLYNQNNDIQEVNIYIHIIINNYIGSLKKCRSY